MDPRNFNHTEDLMRLTGWPTKWNREEGLLAVDMQDVDIHGTPEELRALADFLVRAAGEAARARDERREYRSAVDFPDDKPNPQTPICVEVVCAV
jgi:hypothetical protein